MNWLHGTPTTVRPLSAYSSASFSSALYCGVSPHLEATFTTSVAPPDNSASVVGLPSRVVRGMSLRVTSTTLTLARPDLSPYIDQVMLDVVHSMYCEPAQ